MARTARIRRGPAGTWSNRRWGLRADACGAGFCAVGVGAAPTVGWWCGAAVGAVVLGLARECVLERFRGEDAPAAAGAHPHPVPSPPRAATPTPVADAVIRRPRARGGVRECCRLRAFVPPPVPQGPGRCPQGDGGTSRSSAVESRGRWARRRLVSAPRRCLLPAHCGRSFRRVRRHPTGPHPRPLLTGPGSSNPGPPDGPGCPSRRAVRRSGRRAAPACPARRRAPRPGGQWSVPGRSPWRAPDRPFR